MSFANKLRGRTRRSLKTEMEFTDQLGRTIQIPDVPQRIISCIPSTTELLFDLGLDEEVIGITKFCVHPEAWHTPTAIGAKRRIGGTKNLNFETISELKPDLIICDKEENKREEVEELMKDYNVWVSDTNSLEDGLEMIQLLGLITEKTEAAKKLVGHISQCFGELKSHIGEGMRRPAAYLIWNDPMMVAGRGTFINDMMERCGLDNQFLYNENGYSEVTAEQLHEANPDLVLLSSEPFPFAEKHLPKYQKMLPNADVVLVDGEMFSWPGSRMEKAAAYFRDLLT